MKPYKDQFIDSDNRIREFSPNSDISEFVWHRDKRDRIVEVLGGEGWKFQFENEIPIELRKGEKIKIPKNEYHRIWKGNTNLKIKITEYGG